MAKMNLISAKNRIYAIRHGATAMDPMHRSDGFLDLPLSEDGQRGTVETQQKLKYVDFKSIHTGQLKRHRQTAEIIRSGMSNGGGDQVGTGPQVIVCPEANTWNLGKMAGGPKKPNKAMVIQLMKEPSMRPDGGESYANFGERFWGNFVRKGFQRARAGKGPELWIFSGSNFRYMSEKLFGDRDILDVDEDGCVIFYPTGKTSFGAQVLWGHKDAEDENYS